MGIILRLIYNLFNISDQESVESRYEDEKVEVTVPLEETVGSITISLDIETVATHISKYGIDKEDQPNEFERDPEPLFGQYILFASPVNNSTYCINCDSIRSNNESEVVYSTRFFERKQHIRLCSECHKEFTHQILLEVKENYSNILTSYIV